MPKYNMAHLLISLYRHKDHTPDPPNRRPYLTILTILTVPQKAGICLTESK